MKNEKDARDELDSARMRLMYGLCALLAVHDAMEYAPNTPECYIDGLYGVWDYLNRLVAEVDESVNALFQKNQEEGQA